MEKVERILERCKIYLGVKDVKVVVRLYKTRSAFTNLSSSPPTIYLNEYLIDDEEILEYLTLREMIHIKLNMYRSRYGVPSLSYADKFNSIVNFFLPKEKVEEIRGKDGKADREVNRRLQRPLFPPFYGAFRRRLVLREGLLRRDNVDKGWGKEAYSPAGTSLGICSQV
jgi:hypothetical protein